ncbi:hypothetical protein CBR_g29397 [Chara braunii]|uniref:Uncharacterized protein n=1 Tax=Chara braunii TaxID=69332 RepID=A0A388JWQ0_CHABU|nr:hypothetical protein CBR_g29397 [Chara braunii]|eukprot:GBG62197.1 hypothetical protein CBR_g29397 [Chara braunii]
MDLATLSSVLQMATSQNPEERKLGEDRLVQIVLTDGGRRMKPLKDSSTLQSGSLRQRLRWMKSNQRTCLLLLRDWVACVCDTPRREEAYVAAGRHVAMLK